MLFIDKSNLIITPNNFTEAMKQIELFIFSLLQASKLNNTFNSKWQAPGPWAI